MTSSPPLWSYWLLQFALIVANVIWTYIWWRQRKEWTRWRESYLKERLEHDETNTELAETKDALANLRRVNLTSLMGDLRKQRVETRLAAEKVASSSETTKEVPP